MHGFNGMKTTEIEKTKEIKGWRHFPPLSKNRKTGQIKSSDHA